MQVREGAEALDAAVRVAQNLLTTELDLEDMTPAQNRVQTLSDKLGVML